MECCVAGYAGGNTYHMSKMDKIMLRFRPIAPKPSVAGSVSGSTSVSQQNEVYVSVRTGRGKRRYVKDYSSNKKCSSKKRKTQSPEKNESDRKTTSSEGSVVTLPLLPDSPARSSPSSDQSVDLAKNNFPVLLSFGSNNNIPSEIPHVGSGSFGSNEGYNCNSMMQRHERLAGSWVRVESVSGGWVGGYYDGLGDTDEERLMNLDRGKYPGFVSDGLNRVRWVNRAYREMVGEVVAVWLVVEDGVRMPVAAPFTCRVRVVRCGEEKRSLILPCDVWKMEGGGYAWRLDTEAALSLGR